MHDDIIEQIRHIETMMRTAFVDMPVDQFNEFRRRVAALRQDLSKALNELHDASC